MFNLMKSCPMFTRFGYCFKYKMYNPKIVNSYVSEPTTRDRCLINPFINGTYYIDRSDPIYRNFNLYGSNRAYNNLETDCCGNGCQHCTAITRSSG